jgi:N-methylhydantoinase B
VREIELLSDADVTVLSERRRFRPYGILGGQPGSPGKNLVTSGGNTTDMGGKFYSRLRKGDILRIETPGGGGYGIIKSKKEEEQ